MSPLLGHIAELWRFPVKSMAGEHLEEATLTADGVLGDRAFALFDVETGVIVTASNKRFPGLMDCRAAFVEPPTTAGDLPAIQITLPDGATFTTDDPEAATRLSAFFGRDVTLVRSRSEHDLREQAAFFADLGLENCAPSGSLVDLYPVSLITGATLAALGRARPGSQFDPCRFRMNIVVSGTTEGFPENDWVGARLQLGETAALQVTMPDPRCSMTTLPQGALPRDPAILKTIAQENSVPVGTSRPLPCAGVYAGVTTPGLVRCNDLVVQSQDN